MNIVRKVVFDRLKRLEGTEIDLPRFGVVAIMGANGIGKSTILHALACIYNPDAKIKLSQDKYKWSRYFIPHGNNYWFGSHVTVSFYDKNGTEIYKKENDRWTPKYSRRPERYVKFIGLGDYHPHLEQEKYHSRFSYRTKDIGDKKKEEQLVKYASHVLNRSYITVRVASKPSGTIRSFLQVSVQTGSSGKASEYTSYYMGGGEQKVFHILTSILDAPKGSLILVEEIEVLLHEKALRRLLNVICTLAEQRELQVVFSTHWTGITSFQDKIHVKTLSLSKEGVRCLDGFDAQSMYDISGSDQDRKKIPIWVEDTLSQRIAEKVAAELNLLHNVQARVFGSASNGFTIAASAVLREDASGVLVILDGDVYETDDKKEKQIKATLSGSNVEESQKLALSLISQYTPNTPMSPEKFINFVINSIDANTITHDRVRQYKMFMENTVFIDDSKSVSMCLSEEFKRSIEQIHSDFVDFISETPQWLAYTNEIRNRLRKTAVELGIIKEAAQEQNVAVVAG